jgi:hypothetical protein
VLAHLRRTRGLLAELLPLTELKSGDETGILRPGIDSPNHHRIRKGLRGVGELATQAPE